MLALRIQLELSVEGGYSIDLGRLDACGVSDVIDAILAEIAIDLLCLVKNGQKCSGKSFILFNNSFKLFFLSRGPLES